MIEITVNTQNPYNVVIGCGILPSIGNRISRIGTYEKAAVITDTTVASLYLNHVLHSLNQAGIFAQPIIIETGEKNKNLKCYAAILESIARLELKCSDVVISLGGGVVSDIAGFAAATYMRGIDCCHIPTTLLAIIDATIGGKTGVDLEEGKNLVGAFHHPRLVLSDIDCLDTLPLKEFSNGLCEGIKYAVLAGGELAELLESGLERRDLERFCALCVSYKRNIVESDEHDDGNRRLLNLGHTFGHAIECLSSYTLSHGLCVAKGLNISAKASLRSGGMNTSDFNRLHKLFELYGIDPLCPFNKEELLNKVKNDKKSESKEDINFIVVNGFAACAVKKMTWKELADYVDDCIS